MARSERSTKRSQVHDRVDAWVDEHTESADGRPKYLEDAQAEPTVGELRQQQRDEIADSWVGPGFGITTDAQWKGFLVGALVGGLAGAVLFLPLAFFTWGGTPFWVRLIGVLATGALAGGTAGSLYLGGRMPELENETMDADGRPQIGSTPRDVHHDRRGR